METIKITIPGKPMGKQRHRMGRGFSYTPKETVNYENLVKLCFMDSVKNHTLIDCPVSVSINAYFPIPKGMKKDDRKLFLKSIQNIWADDPQILIKTKKYIKKLNLNKTKL